LNGSRFSPMQQLPRNQPVSPPEPEESGRFTSRIPRELRQDPEIQQRLCELERASGTYLKFDMSRFQNEVNRELETHIGRLNNDYKQH